MWVRRLGNSICVRLVQPEKTDSSIERKSVESSTCFRSVQKAKASFWMRRTCSGRRILFNAVQASKAPTPICERLSGRKTEVNCSQEWNSWRFRDLISGESTICFKLTQWRNAHSPIDFRLSGRRISFKLIQFIKTASPKCVTPSGTMTEVISEQSRNASGPINEIPFGMMTFWAWPR